jgi:uncharacterized protein YpmB
MRSDSILSSPVEQRFDGDSVVVVRRRRHFIIVIIIIIIIIIIPSQLTKALILLMNEESFSNKFCSKNNQTREKTSLEREDKETTT